MDLQVILFIICVAFIVMIAIYLRKKVARQLFVDEFAIKMGGRSRGQSSVRVKNLSRHPRSRSEAAVVQYLEELTGDKFPTVYPNWLVWKGKTLELDGFNGKIALEFSGPLHTKWTPSMESYVDYFERVVRDVVKIRLCKKHKIPLIVVDASLPSRHWRNYVKSRLYDIGSIEEKPLEYIDEQTAVPFRNPQLEKELGLDAEMRAAMQL